MDADACPGVVKEILFRAAKRTGVTLTLVANHSMRVPAAPNVHFKQVPPGFDIADNEIVKCVKAGDIVITADIPLAAEVVEKLAHALNPRGELYTPENICARLNMRDFLDTLRASGVETGGPSAFGPSEKKRFADQLDKLLARRVKSA